MEKVVQPREPERHDIFTCPSWYHFNGRKMMLSSFSRNCVVIKASAAKVIVRRACIVISGTEGWFVDWEIEQFVPNGEKVNGRRNFDDEDLAAAFGLSNKSGRYGGRLIERFGGEVANQGKYIRWRDFLNIPSPGTAHDGDPNVSVHLDDKIKGAVGKLLGIVKI